MTIVRPTIGPSPFRSRKGLGLVKSEGTCEQGERADLTGCTPASGESGGEEKKPDVSKPKPKPKKKLDSSIAKARVQEGLSAFPLEKPPYNKTKIGIKRQEILALHVEEIPISEISTVQRTINPQKVEYFVQGGEPSVKIGEPLAPGSKFLNLGPWAVKTPDGKYYLEDGNNRLSAMAIQGKETVPLKVVEVDENGKWIGQKDIKDIREKYKGLKKNCGWDCDCGACRRSLRKSLEKGIIQDAARWLADRWAQLEERYGRKVALTMAVAGLATFPIPGNVTAIIAAAEAIRAIQGWVSKNMTEDEQKDLDVADLLRRFLAKKEEKGFGENCPHCGTPMERGDDGNCNHCGKPWPAKTLTHSRYMLHDLVNEFRQFMERLRQYGIRVPSLSDEQIARTLEQAIDEAERQEGFRGRKHITLPPVVQDESWSCGAAAVASVCQWFGIEPDTEGEAIRALGSSPSDGTPPWNIVEILEANGLATEAGDWFDLDDLKARHLDRGHPVLVPIQMYGNPNEYEANEGGHWVVLEGVREGKVFIQDPVSGQVEMEVEDFKARWHDSGADGTPYEKFGIACWKPAVAGAKSIGTQAVMDLVRQFNSGPSLSGLRRIKDEMLQLTDEEASAVARKLYPGWRSDESKEDAAIEVFYLLANKVRGKNIPSIVYTERWAIPMMKSSPFLGRMGVLTKDAGRWVTIGSHEGEGGSRVYIEDGKIRKGPSGVEGKPIAEVDQNKEPGTPGGPKEKPKESDEDQSKKRDVENAKEAIAKLEAAGKKKEANQLRASLRDLEKPGKEKAPQVRVFQSGRVREGFSYRQPPEIKEWMNEAFASKYDPAEQKVIDGYSQTEYETINDDLRSGEESESEWTKSRVEVIDKAIQKNRLPEAVKVFRGFNCPSCLKKLKEGGIFQDKAFFSTSLDESVPGEFLNKEPGDIMFHITLPKGTNAGRGSKADESELILPRGSKFRIKKISKGKPTKVEVEYEK